MIILRSIPKLSVAGEEVGPFEENTYFEARNWVADELIKNGFARFVDENEGFSMIDVQKAQIKEAIQTSRRLSTLPPDFYPNLRRFLKELKEKASSEPDKTAEFQKAINLARDIVTSRLNKVLILSSAQDKDENLLKNLTTEERILYEKIYKSINEWRNIVLSLKE